MFTLFAFTSALAISNNHHSSKPFNNEDAEIIKIMMTVDKNEIAAANLTLNKDTQPYVEQYAKYLLKQHTSNLNYLMRFSQTYQIRPQESDISRSLEKAGLKELTMLKTLNGKKFAYTYVKHMIDDHKAGLQLIDHNLLQNVTNEKLKHLVEEFRMMVNNHLQKGLALQSIIKHHS